MRKIFCIIFVMVCGCFVNISAEAADTSVIRLKSGSKMRGVISSSNEKIVTINVENLGVKEFSWDDVVFISSSSVYDSLKGTNSLVVIPPSAKENSIWEKAWSAELMFGSSFKYNRGFGLGLRGNFSIGDYFKAGAVAALHLGINSTRKSESWASFLYWGPEFGFQYPSGAILFEPSFSFGYSLIPVTEDERRVSSISEFYYSPGFSVKADLGDLNVGLQLRYLIIRSTQMPVLYIIFGR